MYVVDTSPEDIERMKITIISATGASWVVDVLPEFSIDKLKFMALSHFLNPIDSIKVSDRYKLVHVSQNRPLPDEGTVRDEDIRENDELLLLRRRSPTIPAGESQEEKEKKCRGPTETEIQKETSSLHPKNFDTAVENPPVPVDFKTAEKISANLATKYGKFIQVIVPSRNSSVIFSLQYDKVGCFISILQPNSSSAMFHTELRKILVSLVKVSEKLLRYHPEVVALFKEMAEADQPVDEKNTVDRTSLKQLTDMGFPESKAVDALKQNSNVSDAMDWLLAQSVDVGSSSSEPQPASKPSSSPSLSRKFSRLSVAKLVEKSHSSSHKEHPPEVPSTSHAATSSASTSSMSPEQNRIVEMIQCFRAYKRKVFRPSAAALANLKEMGFAESDVLDALRINGNNQDTACDWLLSDKKPNFENLEEGLDPEGPIYKSIMSNPVVQLGLSNPKTFLALLHMLENPTSACRWLSDPDTAPILSQIFRIYHAEKHSLQLSRPFPQ